MMRPYRSLSIFLLLIGSLAWAQESSPTSTAPAGSVVQPDSPGGIPRLIKFSGLITDAGAKPRSGVVGLTFALYKDRQGGRPLWLETQNVTFDAQGHYSVLLGSTTSEGLPLDLFAGNEARWLGVTVEGEAESASGGRVLLVSVPYALKAADAETLGGRPASAFLTAAPPTGRGEISNALLQPGRRLKTSAAGVKTGSVNTTTSGGTTGYVAKWTAADTLGNASLFDTGTRVGLGTQTPNFQIDIQNTDTSAAGANLFRIQSPSVNGTTMHFISTGTNGRHWGFGSNFILGNGEFGIYDYTAAASRFWIDSGGRIGLGTTSPQFNLDVQNQDATAAGAAVMRVQTPSVNGATLHFVSQSANGHDWGFGSNFIVGNGEFGIYDYTANANRLFITGTGNVGMGTTSPGQRLSVAGMIESTAGGFKFPDGSVQFAAATGGGSSGWGLTGNTGTGCTTSPCADFVGTTDSSSVEVRVMGNRAFRVEPATDTPFGLGFSPNVIGGFSGNSVGAGFAGATIAGGGAAGKVNTVSSSFGAVGGGLNNTASGGGSAVAGGEANMASGNNAAVAGGQNNTASNLDSNVGGGLLNTASGFVSTVAGGQHNAASGLGSFAAGQYAQADMDGCFAFGDNSTSAPVTCKNTAGTASTNVLVGRFANGVTFYTKNDLTTGVSVPAGAGTWSALSDRNTKENFLPVDGKKILARLIATPITTWNYKSADAPYRHIGPMAQDFYAAFQVGEDDKHITTIDADGVALAAIQGLNQKLEEEIRRKDVEIAAQQEQLEALQQQMREMMTEQRADNNHRIIVDRSNNLLRAR